VAGAGGLAGEGGGSGQGGGGGAGYCQGSLAFFWGRETGRGAGLVGGEKKEIVEEGQFIVGGGGPDEGRLVMVLGCEGCNYKGVTKRGANWGGGGGGGLCANVMIKELKSGGGGNGFYYKPEFLETAGVLV